MAENLNGYTALITGGSSGMGFEMAKQLLSQGATVIITALASPASAGISGEKIIGKDFDAWLERKGIGFEF